MELVRASLLLAGVSACGFPRPADVGDDGLVLDAPGATSMDARRCFGNFINICLAAEPTGSVMHETSVPIDTTNSSMCVTTVSDGNNYCVIAASTILIDVQLRATGTRPLVLLAGDTIVTNSRIDVGSHRGAVPETGAGADPPACVSGLPPGTGGGTGGGGAGGSFTSLGGQGGRGGNAGTAGLPGAVASTVTDLRGGCPGQDGQGYNDRGVGGHGGGAILLIAGSRIEVNGGIIAGGEGGGGGMGNSAGAGGGGAGGMIVLDAPTITLNNLFLATGGGGGEGGDPLVGDSGADGADPTTIDPARGGALYTTQGGDGGNGSTSSSTPALGGAGGAPPPDAGGGGGGGGGAGLIMIPATATAGLKFQIAPPATSQSSSRMKLL